LFKQLAIYKLLIEMQLRRRKKQNELSAMRGDRETAAGVLKKMRMKT